MAKAKEDKTTIKAFKDGSSNWFVNDAHYHLNENNELIWCAGESDKEQLREAILSFIRRNKKSYVKRSPSMFENEPREWSELTFGKFKGFKINEIETKYLKWLILNSADKKLIEEIKDFLKIK